MSSSPIPAHLLVLLAFLVAFAYAPLAEARRNGIQAYGCWGCHSASAASSITFKADRDTIAPGDLVNFTATIASPAIEVGGIFVVAPNLGTLGTASGQGLILSEGSLTHTSPKQASNGTVAFDFTWRAPDEPGAVILGAYFLAGNGNGQNTGDTPGEGYVNFTYGCEAKTFHLDADGDGYGGPTLETTLGCADEPAPSGYAPTDDDCDDGKKTVHPDAPERCNDKDDDCDDEVDEDTMPTLLYPDADGDGFYGSQPGDPIMGCLPLDGYADEAGDCAPIEGTRFPGAEEVCNLYDDDCDGRADEFVRPRCGVGRCEVEGPTCNPEDCVPNPPLIEHCNGLDDDCNGIVDDGDLCAENEACLGIRCVVIDGGESTATGGGNASGGGGAATSSAGAASGGSGTSAASGSANSASNGAGGTRAGSGTEVGGREIDEPGSGATRAEPTTPAATPGAGGCALARSRSATPVLLALALVWLAVRRRRA